PVAPLAQQPVKADADGEIRCAHPSEQVDAVRAEVERVRVDRARAEKERGDDDAVQVEIAERDPERVRRAQVAAEQPLVARRGVHRSSRGPSRPCSSLQYSRPPALSDSARGSSTPQCAQWTRSPTAGPGAG